MIYYINHFAPQLTFVRRSMWNLAFSFLYNIYNFYKSSFICSNPNRIVEMLKEGRMGNQNFQAPICIKTKYYKLIYKR